MAAPPAELFLRFHGRIIDSLGIQMYQSPVAAIAELISNAWDADAESADVTLPASLGPSAQIVIHDTGSGMTLDECQSRYLNVGQNRRAGGQDLSPEKKRPILGRKGIGKFAGFGIAQVVTVDTVSKATGERTRFKLDIEELRSGDYIGTEKKPIDVVAYEAPDDARKAEHGTTVTLERLKLARVPSAGPFRDSMARRFLLAQGADEFAVTVDNIPLPDAGELAGVEIEYPRDYEEGARPVTVTAVEDGWARETLETGEEILWKFRFTAEPISIEELRGVAVFCRKKLAQSPFFFDLSGGFGGQLGQAYLSGQVKADYLDSQDADVITTERQRINWELPEAVSLHTWGKARVGDLLVKWKERRSRKKLALIENKVGQFNERLRKFQNSEQKTIKRALGRLAQIDALSDDQFTDLSKALLVGWENNRLRELTAQVADTDQMDAAQLVALLVEEQVLSALHIAETVRAKVDVLDNLKHRITNSELELAVRDFIAVHPWIISPEWETFAKETRVDSLIKKAAQDAKLDGHDDFRKRVDLTLSSGDRLLILEFMRPGVTVDRDHLDRFQLYIDELRSAVEANTGLGFKRVTGLLVADKLNGRGSTVKAIERIAANDMDCLQWPSLLDRASHQWRDFLQAVRSRAPQDERLSEVASAPPAATIESTSDVAEVLPADVGN